MDTDPWDLRLTAGGRVMPHAGLLVRRHLGLGPAPERWAASLYDRAPTLDATLTPQDLLAAGALGVRLTRDLLAAFDVARPALERSLADLPTDVSLAQADDLTLDRLSTALLAGPLEPTVAAKLLHRARPRLVPPYDRATSDWYAQALGDRDAGRLPQLLRHLRADLRDETNRVSLTQLQELLATTGDGGLVPSRLRLLDIAIWMTSHHA